jgi:hypothetical protein
MMFVNLLCVGVWYARGFDCVFDGTFTRACALPICALGEPLCQ